MSDPQGHSPAADSAPGQETPSQETGPGQETEPAFADRSYRSGSGIVAGVLLLGLTIWLCVDAIVRSHGQARWYAVALLVLLVPLFAAFTVLPSVRANQDRVVVRNPFRTITAHWSEVESIEAGLSVELRAGGKKYPVWAIPVSLRQRKRAGRRAMMASGDRGSLGSRRGRTARGGDDRYPVGGPGLRSRARARASTAAAPNAAYGADANANAAVTGAWADRAVDELRELAAQAEGRPGAVGPVSVARAWWVLVPVVAGAIALVLTAVLG